MRLFRRTRPAPSMPPPLPYDGGQIVPGVFSLPPMNRATATASYTLTPIFTRPPDVVRDELADCDPALTVEEKWSIHFRVDEEIRRQLDELPAEFIERLAELVRPLLEAT